MVLLFSTYSIYSAEGVLGASDDDVEIVEETGSAEEPVKAEPASSDSSESIPKAEEPVETELPQEQSTEPDEEPDQAPDQVSDQEQAQIPVFSLDGELCPIWLAEWQAGTKAELLVNYAVGTSAYSPRHNRCEILAFGLLEVGAGLLRDIPSSGKTVFLREGEASVSGSYVIPQKILDELPSGEYQVYARYAAAGVQEKMVVLGVMDVFHPETAEFLADSPDTPDIPERSDLSDARVVIWTDANEATSFGDMVTAYCEIENLYGWEYSLQWQYSDEQGSWHDIPGAQSSSYSFEWTADNSGFSWRARVDVVIPADASNVEG